MNKSAIVSRNILFPFIMVTSLFALWGAANDLTNPMVSAFKKVMPELSNVQASLVQFAFYFGYFFMALPAALFIRKFSYKSGIILGLGFYAVGAFLFIPAASLENFNFFLVSLWVITCGLAFLETTANPLVLSLGEPETATRRLNLAQAFNPMGSLIGMAAAQLVVISSLKSAAYKTKDEYAALSVAEQASIRSHDLGIISLPYILLGVVVVAVLLIFIFTKMPATTNHQKIDLGESFKKLFANKQYIFGVIAQMFYVGAQIMMWTYIFHYVDNLNQTRAEDAQLTASWWNITAMCIFLSGRWVGTGLMGRLVPAKLLMIYGFTGVTLLGITTFIGGMTGLCTLVAASFCISIMFPTIYGIALKGMGDEAKIGSAGLVMAIVGGSIGPIFMGKILDIGGTGLSDAQILGYIPEVNFAFIVPMLCLVVAAVYGKISIKHH